MTVIAAFGLLCGGSSLLMTAVMIAARHPGPVRDWVYGRG